MSNPNSEPEKKTGSDVKGILGLVSSAFARLKKQSNSSEPFTEKLKNKTSDLKQDKDTENEPLTYPSSPFFNNQQDNRSYDLIVKKNDILNNRYKVDSVLGKGVYGQVIKCLDKETNDFVAVKIIKNHPDFNRQAKIEVNILQELKKVKKPKNETTIVNLCTVFTHLNHLCLVFELLGENLYERIKKNNFEGIKIQTLSSITKQCLFCLKTLHELNIIHCDLKPENILYTKNNEDNVKVIDFGSATFDHNTSSFYIQSRFYRAPEVLLGIEYNYKIDMWSLGCICSELFLGIPIFAGCSAYDQVSKIVNFLQIPPNNIIEGGRTSFLYFDEQPHEKLDRLKYVLKSEDKYCEDTGHPKKGQKKYFKEKTIKNLILNKLSKNENLEGEELENRKLALIDFLRGILTWDPTKRWTPPQALLHPFITGEKFTQNFRPPLQTSIPVLISNPRKSRNPYKNSYYQKPMLGLSPNHHGFKTPPSYYSPPRNVYFPSTSPQNPFLSLSMANNQSSGSSNGRNQFIMPNSFGKNFQQRRMSNEFSPKQFIDPNNTPVGKSFKRRSFKRKSKNYHRKNKYMYSSSWDNNTLYYSPEKDYYNGPPPKDFYNGHYEFFSPQQQQQYNSGQKKKQYYSPPKEEDGMMFDMEINKKKTYSGSQSGKKQRSRGYFSNIRRRERNSMDYGQANKGKYKKNFMIDEIKRMSKQKKYQKKRNRTNSNDFMKKKNENEVDFEYKKSKPIPIRRQKKPHKFINSWYDTRSSQYYQSSDSGGGSNETKNEKNEKNDRRNSKNWSFY